LEGWQVKMMKRRHLNTIKASAQKREMPQDLGQSPDNWRKGAGVDHFVVPVGLAFRRRGWYAVCYEITAPK